MENTSHAANHDAKPKKVRMVLYRISQSDPALENAGKATWEDVGVAFQNKDNSWNLVIDKPLSTSDRLNLRLPRPKKD